MLVGSLAAAACGSAQALPPPKHPTPGPGPCAAQIHQLEHAATTDAAGGGGGGIVLMTAARLESKVVVTPSASGPECAVLEPGKTVHLAVGEKLVFVANDAPFLSGATSAVDVSTGPGPSTQFGGLSTSHVIVTLTAAHPGSVNVDWSNCSGTAC